METAKLQTRIDYYLINSDKLSQFHDAAAIAKQALVEVDILNAKSNTINLRGGFILNVQLTNNEFHCTNFKNWLRQEDFTFTYKENNDGFLFEVICDDLTDGAKIENFINIIHL